MASEGVGRFLGREARGNSEPLADSPLPCHLPEVCRFAHGWTWRPGEKVNQPSSPTQRVTPDPRWLHPTAGARHERML